ncbi:MAG: hypothetical protein IKQ15_12885, partial [Kiritimatiellae bacterium]|nr:hypothetical protein [Kiritimatiellia bacterium]
MSPRPAVLASAVLACALLAAAGCGRATPEKLLRDAARDMEAGRIEAAAGKLERALAAEPDGPAAADAWNRLGLA